MKISAFIECMQDLSKPDADLLRKLRKASDSDYLLMVTGGDFLISGLFSAADKNTKADNLLASGAEAVAILPLAGTLADAETGTFSAISLLSRLRCTDEILVLHRKAEPDRLRELASYLFQEPPEFQKSVRSFASRGDTVQEAERKALAVHFKDSEKILSYAENRAAVEILRAMKRLYCPIPVRFFSADTLAGRADPVPEERKEILFQEERVFHLSAERDRLLAKALRNRLREIPENELPRILDDTAGGTEALTRGISGKKQDLLEAEDFSGIVSNFADSDYRREQAGLFLLRFLTGMLRQYQAAAGLYSYCPYIRLLLPQGERCPERIEKCAWSPVLIEHTGQDDSEMSAYIRQVLDFDRQLLYNLDQKGHRLYMRTAPSIM